MNPLCLAALAIALAAGPAAGAQLYKWVDDKGRVEWRDTPPPADAKNVETRTMHGNTVQTSNLPYSVQQAVKNFPVTLWVVPDCEPCTAARNHLAKRGVPHTEHNAQKEPAALKKLTGSMDVPILTVGSRTLKGYLDTDWDAALDSAGYPRTPPPGMKAQTQASSATKGAADGAKATSSTTGKGAADTPKATTPKPTARQP
jgi:glutaredoxin